MGSILRYFSNMAPYMALSVPFTAVFRFIIYKRAKKINLAREIVMFLFVAFVLGLASQTVIPKVEIYENGIRFLKYGRSGFNLIPFKMIFVMVNEFFTRGNYDFFIVNFIGNIVVFMPIGFTLPLLWNINMKKTVLIGALSSFFIEFLQLFLQRGSDIDDIILNTAGTFFGYLIFELLAEKFVLFKNVGSI